MLLKRAPTRPALVVDVVVIDEFVFVIVRIFWIANSVAIDQVIRSP